MARYEPLSLVLYIVQLYDKPDPSYMEQALRRTASV